MNHSHVNTKGRLSLNSGTSEAEPTKELSALSAVENQLLPIASPSGDQQIQSQLLKTEIGQENENDLVVKVMTSGGTISVSRIQLND